MYYLVFDTQTRRCTGVLDGREDGFQGGLLVQVDAIPQDITALVLNDAGDVVRDAALALALAQQARIAQIKTEAAALLDSTAWMVERVTEREKAGWATLADVSAVLAEREAVRRSSSAAEAAVLALEDSAAVWDFTWTPADVAVPAPRLLTHEKFIQTFSAQEWEAMTEAARTNASMDAWMRRFALADVVNLDDAYTAAGVQALEIAGLIGPGRAHQILG